MYKFTKWYLDKGFDYQALWISFIDTFSDKQYADFYFSDSLLF